MCPLSTIAKDVGTPVYVYSQATLERHFKVFDQAFEGLDHLVCFAAKANSSQAVVATMARLGAGADIVSGGELARGMAAGVPAERIVYSGVGKSEAEMRSALDAGILMFNIESAQELAVLNEVAGRNGQKSPGEPPGESGRGCPDPPPRSPPACPRTSSVWTLSWPSSSTRRLPSYPTWSSRVCPAISAASSPRSSPLPTPWSAWGS